MNQNMLKNALLFLKKL